MGRGLIWVEKRCSTASPSFVENPHHTLGSLDLNVTKLKFQNLLFSLTNRFALTFSFDKKNNILVGLARGVIPNRDAAKKCQGCFQTCLLTLYMWYDIDRYRLYFLPGKNAVIFFKAKRLREPENVE